MFWNKYPYTDFHELNLDMILKMIKELHQEWSEFKILNTITFDGEWNITKQYPAWCIVNTAGGTQGYISIKPVPAGVTINNTEYWQSIVDYTATIADLQARMIQCENDIADINFRWRAPEVICIGDSFLQQTENWGKYLKTRMGVANDKWHVSGVPAVGFYGDNFKNQLDAVIASLSDPDNVTHIIAIGGTNDVDAGTITSVNDGIQHFMDSAHAGCPNAKVYIGFVCTRFSSTYYQTDSVYNKSLCYRYYERTCSVNDGIFIPHLTESLFTGGRLKSDWIHPTEEGAATLADIIYNAVNGSNFAVPARYESNTLTLTQQSGGLTYTLHGAREHTKLTINGFNVTGLVITPQTWLPILTYDELPIKPSIMHVEQGIVRLNTAGMMDYVFVTVTMQLSVNGLRIRFDNNTTEPSGTKNLNSMNCYITFDLMPIL